MNSTSITDLKVVLPAMDGYTYIINIDFFSLHHNWLLFFVIDYISSNSLNPFMIDTIEKFILK